MIASVSRSALLIAFGVLAISSASSALAAECLAPLKNVTITASSRLACLEKAQVILPDSELPQLSVESIAKGYGEPTDSIQNSLVWCRFTPHDKPVGDTSKFRCHRTTENYLAFLNKEGQPVPQAASANMESELFNSAGQKIEKEKADKVKVKYLFDKDRDREVFTEVVVSRVWWALGIPVDRMYPVSVKCKGCEKGEDYPVAALERKFPGKEIETKPDQGWDFKTEITPGYLKAKKTGDPRAVELEALVLAANLVTYHNGANFQNRLSCLEWDKSTGKCSKTIIYISDLGSSLAGPRKPNASMNPRGDFAYWKEQTVFKDAKSCAPRYTLGLPADLKISESARRLMADRLQRLIKDPEQVRMIFRVARMEKADPALAAEIKKKLGTDNLDAKIIEAWSQKLISMANEIISARCPN